MTAAPDFGALLKAAIAASGKTTGGSTSKSSVSSVSTGVVFTPAEANSAVQSVYQQLLGRNASGNDYAKAYSIAMAQSKDTSTYGRQQAIMNEVMASPEYKARQDNKYLDAIYNAISADVRRTRQ